MPRNRTPFILQIIRISVDVQSSSGAMRTACKFDWFPGPEYQQSDGERIFFLVTKVVIRDEIEKF